MARAKRICPRPGCHRVVQGRYCVEHNREYEAKRGTPEQRGYDATHRALRRHWSPRVATGNVPCWRCGELIEPGERWDLGHDDADRSKHRGPEHASRCNRSAAGRKAHEFD